jgi:predicted acyltransferase (DUF342 family)
MSTWLSDLGANRYLKTYMKGFLDISGGNLILRNGDISLNGRLFVQGDASMINVDVSGFIRQRNIQYVSGDNSGGDWLQNSNNSNLLSQSYVAGFMNISGGDLTLYNTNNIYMQGGMIQQLSTTYAATPQNYTYLSWNDLSSSFASINGSPTFKSNVTIIGNGVGNGLTVTSGNVFLGTAVVAANDVSINGRLFVGGDVSINGRIYTNKDSSFGGNLSVGGNFYLGTNLITATQTSILVNSIPITGGGGSSNMYYADISTNYRLLITGDTSLNARLFVGGDTSLNARLFVGGDISTNGNLNVNGITTISSMLITKNDVSFNKRLFVGWDTSMMGNVQIGQVLNVFGKSTLSGDVSMNNRLFVGWDTSMMGNVQIGKLLNLMYDGSFNGNLNIKGSLTIGSGPTTNPPPPLYIGTGVTGNTSLSSGSTITTSIYAAQSIISNGGLYASYGTWNSSDERIKKDVQNIDGVYALSVLRDIRPTQYNLIDSKMHKNPFNYGFIAQEIDLLIQNSVHKTCQYLPNIFDNATILNKHIIRLRNKSTNLFIHDASNNNKINIKLLDEYNNEYFNTISRIIDDKTFEIDIPLKHETIFVYGQEVADFHYLDKDSIFTITTAALKEVDKELQETRLYIREQDIKMNQLQSQIDYIALKMNRKNSYCNMS